MKLTPFRGRRAFTLIELLIVITIIAILVAVSLAAFNGIKKRAQRTAAVAALKTINQTVELYAGDNNGYYPPGEDGSIQISALQSAALADQTMLAFYISEMLDESAGQDSQDNANRRVLSEIVPRFALPFLQANAGDENRELYYLFHVDIDNTDPEPGPDAINPGNSVWGKKSASIGFSRTEVPMLSDAYLGAAWDDFKSEDKQTLWGHSFNVLYYDGSVATMREDAFLWREVIPAGG